MRAGLIQALLRSAAVPAVIACLAVVPGPAAGQEPEPYGAASSYVIGRRLLLEGNTEEALSHLHYAYRADPDVRDVAWDFQSALAAEGYIEDAVQVLDAMLVRAAGDAEARVQRARLNLRLRRHDEALADLKALREAGQQTLEVLSLEASILSARGKVSEALDVLREGIEVFPESAAEIYLGMAGVMRENGKPDGLAPLLREAVQTVPGDPRLILAMIRTEAALGNLDRALELAAQADRQFGLPVPGGGPRLQGAEPGGLDDGSGLPAESFRIELADFYVQHGSLDRGADILQEMDRRGELGQDATLWLGRLLFGTGRGEDAEALVGRALAAWPLSAKAWLLQGRLAEGQGDMPEAVRAYDRAVGLEPADGEARLSLIRIMMLTREAELRVTGSEPRQELARQVVAAAAVVPEQDAEGQMVLGYAQRILGNYERSARRFELAAARPELRLNSLVQASLSFDQAGMPGRARDSLETLRREFPDNPEVANSYGYFLAEKNQDLDLAEELVRQALAADPNNGAYLDSLGWVLYRKQRLDDALDQLIRAVNVLPDDPVILEHLGVVLLDLGQAGEAQGILQRALSLGGEAERLQALLEQAAAAAGPKEN